MTLVLAIEALSVRLGSRLELLLSRGNALAAAFLEGLLCTLTFLKGGLVDHQHMIILFDVHLRSLQLCEELGDRISGTNLIVSHYKTFVVGGSDCRTLSILSSSGILQPSCSRR